MECLSPAVFPDAEIGWPELSVGTHAFLVQAVDLNDNIDPTPASRTWTVVEPLAPNTTITAGPDATTSSTSASFSFSSTEPGVVVRVLARRRRVRTLPVAARVLRPRPRRPRAAGRREGRRGPPRLHARHVHVEDRGARHPGARDDDHGHAARPDQPPGRHASASRPATRARGSSARSTAPPTRPAPRPSSTPASWRAGTPSGCARPIRPGNTRPERGDALLDRRPDGAGHRDHRAGRPTRARATS